VSSPAAPEPRTLLIDALGTLVTLEPPAPVLAGLLRARFGLRITEAQAERAIAEEIAYYRAHFDEGRDHAGLADLRARCAESLRAALAPKDCLAEIGNAALTQALIASLRFSAFPDARPAIRIARERGWRIVVASNWDVSLHELLERLAFTPLLHGIVTSAETGVRKPAPEIFRRALALGGAGAERAMHVGDSLAEDVEGALAAGIEPILLARDGSPGPPGVRAIRSLLELFEPKGP
jgi:putative hydrolase of the HAD superfamily